MSVACRVKKGTGSRRPSLTEVTQLRELKERLGRMLSSILDSMWRCLWAIGGTMSGSDGNTSQELRRGVQATDTQAWEMNQ